MRSHIILCLLVGLAFASNNPGWKDNTEYVYQIRGRTLASLHEVDNQYSGILLKAKLTIQPNEEGILNARISDAQYGQVHTQLPEGWNSYIQDSELNYKQLPISGKPFQIVMKNGVVRDLIVEKEISNWESNIIKSIVSQFQLDTKAENLIQSRVNTLPEESSHTAVFKTMEDTITGKTETLYDIHLLPEYILESQPWLAPVRNLKGNGEFIEIVKNKNYSRSEERPLYHYGLNGLGQFETASNQMGKFFVREAISRAVISGTLERYTVQNSFTVNKVVMSPTLNDKQKGSVVSMLNVTLTEVHASQGKVQGPSSPVSLNSLVYRFNTPFADNKVRTQQWRNERFFTESGEYNKRYDSSEERMRSPSQRRFLRSVEQNQVYSDISDSSSFEENWQQQEQPKMNSVPESPFLPYTMGYKGNSIRKEINLVQEAQKVAKEIGQNMQKPEEIVRQDTLAKYVILSALTRVMKPEELQQVGQELYSQEIQGPKRASWVAFRDAVAESGTGPAFLTIQQWIENKKIQEEEAAQVVYAMADSVRQPTLEYVRSFFELIQKPVVKNQLHLNESALFAFSNLVREVYVSKEQSHNEFPVHSFGTFRTQEGKNYLKETIIPYFTKHLHEAIVRGDTQQIHVYIRALGYVAHQDILPAFEPYLEGKKQASQFQRVLMVVSMDKLAKVHPALARSVLYKIYQNTGDSQEIRIAAVYQLMRTSPPTDLLQRMAAYTKIDASEYVNAAVKSSIQSAAELEGEEFQYLRSSAQAALPLVTEKEYGVQHALNYLRSYFVEELNLRYKQTVQVVGSDDSLLPQSLKYSLRSNVGGLKRQTVIAHAMVSSIEELFRVFARQTEYHKEQEKQTEQGQQGQWSSQNIARMLNMQPREKEQLEGILNIEFGSIQKLLSFDNNTIERLPEIIRELEESLKSGKVLQYSKLFNSEEITISFPTEMGFPFMYTYDRPTLISLRGKLQASANPQVSSGNKLNKPHTVSAQGEIELLVATKTQGKLSFVTPFDHQQYSSGYDKVAQVHLPLRGKIDVDVKNMQVEFELEPIHQQKTQVLHYSSWPYTAKFDILNFQPVSLRPTTQVIKSRTQQRHNFVYGKKQTGLAFNVDAIYQPKYWNLDDFHKLLHHENIITGLLHLWDNSKIQHSKINVEYVPEESSTRKLKLRVGHQSQYHQHQDESNESSSNDLSQLMKTPSEPMARQQDFVKKAASGIHNSQTVVCDASFEFQGDKNIKYTITSAISKSNVDPKSRVLVYLHKTSDSQDSKPFLVVLSAKSHIPNTNGLDVTESLKQEPIFNTQVQLAIGQNYESAAKIQGQIELRRSEERKQYLLDEPMFHHCKREMQEGNFQLPACVNMTFRANLLDRVNMKVQYENIKPEYGVLAERAFEMIRTLYWPATEIKSIEKEQGQINAQVRFHPNMEAVNFTVRAHGEETHMKNIRVANWAKPMVYVHPVFHLRSRVLGKALALQQSFRPICVVDQTKANTFNNRTYPISIGNTWTVMLQYVPVMARQHQHQYKTVEEQLKHQIYNYAVLVRDSQQGKSEKEVKITLSTPQTEFKVLDITMQPAAGKSGSSPMAKVFVDGQEIKIDDKQSHDIKEGYVQIYALPNGEVKVEVQNAFYVIYDGKRVRLTALNGKLRGSTRGLCGQYNEERATDFFTPENCIIREAREFIESYGVQENKQRTQTHQGHCSQQTVLYANVISDLDAGREQQYNSQRERHSGMCTKHQTRYVEQNGEICFTLRPMPVCTCQQRGTILKNVAVHCVQKSNVADLWKKQIDKGASPDFSLKSESKTVQMELPQGCSK